jgi:hypothetical protein
MAEAEQQGAMSVAQGAASGAAAGSMVVPGWGTAIGAVVGAAGAGLSLMGSSKRAKAMERVLRERRQEEERYGQEQFRISDNLRKAMEGIALAHGEELTAYMEARNSPARIAAAQEAEQRQVDAGQSGMDRALAALAGPNTVRAPDQAPYTESLETNLADQRPGLQALLDQIQNSGYLSGLSDYDTGNRQGMDLRLAPLQNVVGNEMLVGGVESAENSRFNQLMRQHLGLKAQDAERAGNGLSLAGGLTALAGQGIAAYGAAQPGTQASVPLTQDEVNYAAQFIDGFGTSGTSPAGYAPPQVSTGYPRLRQPGEPNIDPVWSANNL